MTSSDQSRQEPQPGEDEDDPRPDVSDAEEVDPGTSSPEASSDTHDTGSAPAPDLPADAALVELDKREDKRSSGLRPVVFYSLLGGLCPLVPVPFLDDVIIAFLRRYMLRDIGSAYGLTFKSAQLRKLRERPGSRLIGCLKLVVLYPIKKIFRKVFYFLAVKEAVDIASELLHEGFLLRIAITRREITAEQVEAGEIAPFERVRDAMVLTCKDYDTSPINQALRRVFSGSKTLINEVKTTVVAREVDADDPEAVEDALKRLDTGEDKALGRLLKKVTEVVWAKEGYLADLEERFMAKLAEGDAKAKNTGS